MKRLTDAASETRYPGRGIVLGRSTEGAHAIIAYFIMGRSENSRNRLFVAEGDGLRTQAHDPRKLTDPSLIIYAPVRVLGGRTIVTNGDQTDTIHDALAAGGSFEDALRTRTFEPDGPNWTPRISGLLSLSEGGLSYKLSILKSAEGDPEVALRFFFEYGTPPAGHGHFLHTYAGDGDPLPSFHGEPTPVRLDGDIDAFTRTLWERLDPENRVALFVRFLPLKGQPHEDRIINSHSEAITR